MHFTFRNINAAFRGLVEGIHNKSIPTRLTSSRNGSVMQVEEPVIITYQYPLERVLFNQARDCNPTFHLYEALWMLSGRNDVAPLAYYANNIANYSDDGKILNGAYGYRWRHAPIKVGRGTTFYKECDQLQVIINHLREFPDSRRAVLQMWNVQNDLLKIGSNLPFMEGSLSKDTCCNLSALFFIRKEEEIDYLEEDGWSEQGSAVYKTTSYLDMTVFNRSNDLIWGALGANVVHFSFLLEYMASHIGVEVGVYNQVSNNLHCYTAEGRWEPEKWLNDPLGDCYSSNKPLVNSIPLIENPDHFEKELQDFVEDNYPKIGTEVIWTPSDWTEPFLRDVAQPMCNAFHAHKQRKYKNAMSWVNEIISDDWQLAAKNWILKRKANWETKQGKELES
jgi:hypothetical protein